MKPIEILMEEHRVIEKGLDALDLFAKRAGGGGLAEERTLLGRFVEFIREFADKIHHGKEEDILFDEMERSGFPRNGGPLAVMYAEHEEGRRQVGILARLASSPIPWTEGDREDLVRAATAYTSLLRQHILKEDHVLYPMSEKNLPREAWARIEMRFSEFEEEPKRRAEKERLKKLVG